MDYSNKIARYEEIERRGLLDRLPPEKQEAWAEYKKRQQSKLELSDEQKAQIEANNKAYEEKYAEPFIESDIVRKPAALAQGISNASLNPFGYLARSAGIDTKPLEAKDAAERALEKGGEYGYDAAALATIGNIAKGAGYLGKGNTVTSKVAQEVLAPEVLMATGAGVGGGLVEGVTNPSTAFGSAVANIIGASVPASVGGALEKQIYNVKGGLENILSNNKGVQAVARGIATDEAIANRVKEEAPVAMNNLNERMRNALNRLTGRKLDIGQANVNQQNRYNEFIGKNADRELLDFGTPAQHGKQTLIEQLNSGKFTDIPFGSLPDNVTEAVNKIRIEQGQPPIKPEMLIPANVVKKWAGKRLGQKYTPERVAQIADEVYHSADVNVSTSEYPHIQKLFKDRQGHKNDFVGFVSQNGETGDTVAKTVYQTRRGSAGRSPASLQDYPAGSMRLSDLQASSVDNIVPNQKVVVNKNLPRLTAYTSDLNEFQKDALNQALGKGAYMSTNAKGTLGATHRGQEVLNDMIEASYDTSIIGQKKPTTETRQLMQVKERLNQILEPSGIKPYDASLSKAKALQDAYEKGYKFKPSETKFEALGLDKARDKRAFLQGRIASILDNVKDDKNIAKAIQADENTLRKLMPEGKYKQLLKDANQIDTEYERVKSLARQAESKLVKKVAKGRPMSEITETQGSVKGTVLGNILSAITRRGDIRRANQYLNPETTQIVTREGLKGAAKKGSSAALRQLLIDRLEED